MIRFFRKYHKWLSVIFALIILSYVISGIILNHRNLFSALDISRKLLPDVYGYNNWNNSAVKSTLRISPDSVLLYGNIGVWLTDSSFSRFTGLNEGFPAGIDNRRVFQMIKTSDNDILAGTFSGLYSFDRGENRWTEIPLPVKDKRIVDLIEKQDTLFLLTRSFLLKSSDIRDFSVITLPPPEDYDNRADLFRTIWTIHSGEIYGLAGRIIIDIAGLIFAFLTITGLIVFFNKLILKIDKTDPEKRKRLKFSNRWNLKWHNRIGWITLVILVLNTVTGMFLRPPLLAFIGNSRVGQIPLTVLAGPNTWHDQLRRLCYDEESDRFIIAASGGFYYSDDNFTSDLRKFRHQPPASIMGVNVLEKTDIDNFLVGSFEGLFLWNPETGRVFDYIKKTEYAGNTGPGRPIGDNMVSGFTSDFNSREFFFDYNSGAIPIDTGQPFPKMTEQILEDSPMSLWNIALEIHTARIYQPLIGDFYVLIVPLTGLIVLFILISGFIVWLKIRKIEPDQGP